MDKKVFVAFVAIIAMVITSSDTLLAAEKKTTAAPAQKAAAAKAVAPKANFAMIAGTIESIDNTDPANVKVSVKNDTDGSVRTVSVTPWTNITKVTDISELKTGEQVRMMARKVDDKDVAMGIMFGKVKTKPAPIAAVNAAQASNAKATKAKK